MMSCLAANVVEMLWMFSFLGLVRSVKFRVPHKCGEVRSLIIRLQVNGATVFHLCQLFSLIPESDV